MDFIIVCDSHVAPLCPPPVYILQGCLGQLYQAVRLLESMKL